MNISPIESPGPASVPPEVVNITGRCNKELVLAGIVLGMGFGGLADGIVLHQILGWHHLVCYTVNCQPTSVAQLLHENMQDGLFHLGLWITTLAGVVLLFRAGRPAGGTWRGRVLTGGILAGSGLFNFFEGLLNHQILGIHHVLPGSAHQFLWDMLYLSNGVLFFVVGMWLARGGGKDGSARSEVV